MCSTPIEINSSTLAVAKGNPFVLGPLATLHCACKRRCHLVGLGLCQLWYGLWLRIPRHFFLGTTDEHFS
jgi:hypothetical protein